MSYLSWIWPNSNQGSSVDGECERTMESQQSTPQVIYSRHMANQDDEHDDEGNVYVNKFELVETPQKSQTPSQSSEKEKFLQEIQEKENNIEALTKQKEKLENEKSRFGEDIEMKNEQISHLEVEKERTMEKLITNEKQLKQHKSKLEEKEKVIIKLQEEVDALKNRISQIAGAKLSDNNPGITDLSDPNRPLKLGEMFSELYDNEWTDAMEEREPIEGEKKAVQTLLDIVHEAYIFCLHKSLQYLDDMTARLALFNGLTSEEISTEVSKGMKDYRKTLAPYVISALQNEFCMGKTGSNYTDNSKTDSYQKRCVAVCWLMAVQDPAVYIDCKVPTTFDEDRYKAYTQKGKQVDFLVWPVLYLHQDGPLMGKGVAQGKY